MDSQPRRQHLHRPRLPVARSHTLPAAPRPGDQTEASQRTALLQPPYRARPQEYIPEDPIWRVQYRDELWFADYPGLAIMQAFGKQGALNYQGYLPTFQQPEEKKLTLQFFPGQGPDRNHTQTIRTGDGAPAVTFDGDRVEELGWAQANVCRDKLDITLRSRAHKALILFPALGTPTLLCGQGKQLKIILAVSDAFHQAINAERQTNPAKSIGPMTLRRLHAQFRLKPWGESDKHHPDLDRIYENWQTAQENIRLYPRGELKNSSETGLPVSDNNGKCIGILHPDIIDFYRKHGYTRLYQVNLNKLPPSPGLYNLVWHYPDDEEENPSPIDKESHHGCSHEPQDRLQADYFSQAKKQGGKQIDRSRLNPCDRRRRKQPELTGDGRYTGGTPFSEGTAESGLWLESRHPVYISDKPKLNPGHLSNLHLSSRQALYPDSPAQLIPGADTATSPPLGPQSHHNAAALKRLLDAMGKDPEIDLLLLTGDLYDHAINADPAHEAYEMPYGISPRLNGGNEMFMFLHGQRANAGILADHGLTIYEAALLYGPGYGHYHTLDNFKADNLCWLHHLITPWRDWVTAHGKQQTWIGLGWGDDEEYAGSTATGGGSLPRANQACTDDQWALVQNAVEKAPAAEKLLLSHFTYVNYATDILLTTGNSKIDADDVSPGDIGPGDRDNLDEDSFHDNRKALYETYMLPGKIHYTFSGHSHRAGVYRLTGEPGYVTRKITTRGDYPDGYTHPDGTACLLVAGSGGPITRQNREGEYAGYGIEAPQGLKLDTKIGKVSIVRDAQTRPRMAVLLDYLWYEGEHKALQYGLKGDGRQFRLRLDQRWINASEHGGKILDEIHLHLHSGGKAGYQGYIQLKQAACEASQWTERVSLGRRSCRFVGSMWSMRLLKGKGGFFKAQGKNIRA